MNEDSNILRLTVKEIIDYIKIDYPVLMLDEAEVVPGKYATGRKMLTYNEAFWQGHYPDYPIMPGTYQLEALGQLFLLTVLTNDIEELQSVPKLAGFDQVRFFRGVFPGNKLEMRVELLSYKRGLAKGAAKAYVNGEIVCSAEIKTVIK